MLKRLLLFTAVAAVMVGGNVQAQESAIIQATASVVSSMTVQGTNGLAFGAVTPGVNKSVDKTAAGSAGEWRVTGDPGAEVTLAFTLPTSLAHTTDPTTLSISFNSTDASYEDGTGAGQAAPAASIDPDIVSTVNIAGDGTLWVWIGGTVAPSVSETAGNYSGDITLTVTYTGN